MKNNLSKAKVKYEETSAFSIKVTVGGDSVDDGGVQLCNQV